jgi:outer membrane protein TolC
MVLLPNRGGVPAVRPADRLAGWAISAVLAVGAVLAGGCVLDPAGAGDERAKVGDHAAVYERPFAERQPPALATQPDWSEVLQRAFLANGDLESSYFEWQAAVSRIQIAAAYPNTNIQIGFGFMFSKEKMKAWDRTTISAGFDPSMMLQLPVKVQQAGKVALAEAQAKGLRFAVAKFALQQKVLTAWFDYALVAEKLRIQEQNAQLLRMIADIAAQRVRAGAPQQDLLKAQTEYEVAINEQANMAADLRTMRAMLNGLLARPADSALPAPAVLPGPRPIPADDGRLLAAAVDRNPELAALAKEVAGRGEILVQAQLAYLPDISPEITINGGISQAISAMISFPLALPKIEGAIKESAAMLRASEATARQARSDRSAGFLATLVALRNNERQVHLFGDVILPQARKVLASSQQAYVGGTVAFADLIDSQRTLLSVHTFIAEARMAREKRLVELEALAGLDIETLAGGPSGPTTRPTSRPAELE